MWLTLAFTSAALLGFYDAAKKKALTGNAVLPVLLLNTLFSTLFFLPAILSAEFGLGWFDHTLLATAPGTWEAHALVVLKSAIVLTFRSPSSGRSTPRAPLWCSSGRS